MTTPAVPLTEPNRGPERETMPPPLDPFTDAFGVRDNPEDDAEGEDD